MLREISKYSISLLLMTSTLLPRVLHAKCLPLRYGNHDGRGRESILNTGIADRGNDWVRYRLGSQPLRGQISH
jgi:hypothetical protein